jgi:hypothetical protein
LSKKKKFPDVSNPAAQALSGPPRDCFDMVNKYGTYNVQDTSATPNDFPCHSPGPAQEEKDRATPVKRLR